MIFFLGDIVFQRYFHEKIHLIVIADSDLST